MSDPESGQAGATEVTPAMIDAGVRTLDHAASSFAEVDLVRAVYIARARKAEAHKAPSSPDDAAA